MAYTPHKAEPILVARKARVHELAQAALHSAREQMRLNARGARAGKDPDYTHQLRVGARRARVVARLFRNFIEPATARALERDLRWISRVMGEVRDRDVLLARVRASDAATTATAKHTPEKPTPEGLLPVERELTRQRKVAARAAKRALVGARFSGLLRRLSALERGLAKTTTSPRARKWAKKRLQKRLDAVLARRDAVAGTDHEARHELRKQLKKLRYTAELVRSLWRAKRVKHYLASMSDLQDALGALNDDATGKRLLAETKKRTGKDAANGLAALLRELDSDLAKQLEPMRPAFDEFAEATPFWA